MALLPDHRVTLSLLPIPSRSIGNDLGQARAPGAPTKQLMGFAGVTHQCRWIPLPSSYYLQRHLEGQL
jgi:hypothetical protein